MRSNALSLLPILSLAGLFAVSAGCAVSNGEEATDEDAAMENELTSASALSRALAFEGIVYVDASAGDATILQTVRHQTQTAFGALRTAQIGVNSRELKDVDPTTFVKTKVTMIDTSKVGDKGTPMLRVKYRYTDMAVVPKSFSRRSSLHLAVMGKGYEFKTDRILTECTDNDSEARDFQSSIWYVFNPSLSRCKTAITTEQKAIDADTAKLSTPATQVTKSEVERLYLPTTVKLSGNKTNTGASYPEYDRLYAGGVQKGKLVIGLVNGMIDHGHATNLSDDSGYTDWMETLRQVFAARKGFKLLKIAPNEDLSTFTINGKKVTGTFDDFIKWKLDGTGFPTNLSFAEREQLVVEVGKRIGRHWLTFEAPITVKIGSAAPTNAAIQVLTYFGAESDATPHKFAIKNSDVFLYNGHSYIGYGPLDPNNFSASDFPSSYQILFIDGCVSYNYYEKDYYPLKSGGSKNLELITNGLEAPSWRSGYALGRFLARMIDGTQASYRDLLVAANATDSLRVVDGELDNVYLPTKTPITVSAR